MNVINERFGHAAVLPVLHVVDERQALRNIGVAQGEADGAFIIDHKIQDPKFLFDIAAKAKGLNPEGWLGINVLGMAPLDVLHTISNGYVPVDALWTDNAGVYLDRPPNYPRSVFEFRNNTPRLVNVGLFGGVAMKGAGYIGDPLAAAQLAEKAAPFMDVVTTSGVDTGIAESPTKIIEMKRAIGNQALGLCSGVSLSTVEGYLGHVSAYLVATGIAKSWVEIDPFKLTDLVQIVRSTEPAKIA